MENKFNDIVLRDKEKRLSISRIPKNTKEEFVAFAEEEFCGDYGMAFKSIFDNFKLWKLLFENIDMKLDLLLLNSNKSELEEQFDIKTMMNGRKIKIKRKEVKHE